MGKTFLDYFHLPSDLPLRLTLSGSNYPCLEQISIVPKMFEPLKFDCISNFRSQTAYTFVKCGCSIYFFLSSANLFCRGMDISKYLRESIGLPYNENRLYMSPHLGDEMHLLLSSIRLYEANHCTVECKDHHLITQKRKCYKDDWCPFTVVFI